MLATIAPWYINGTIRGSDGRASMLDGGLPHCLPTRLQARPPHGLRPCGSLYRRAGGRNDAGRAGVTRAVGIIDDHRATQALRGTAAEFGAGHAEVLTQEIVHRQIIAHVHRAVRAAVDREAECRHASAPLSMV